MKDNYTSFKVHSNYYAGILDVIEDLPEAERNSILAEYFLAFHEYGNTRKIPEFKNKIAQGFFHAILYSVDKSFEKNDNYQASQDAGSYGGKQKAINAKIRAAEKKYQECVKKLEELEASDQIKPKNIQKDDKSVDNQGIIIGPSKEQQSKAHRPQQLTAEEKQKAQISKIVSKLNWNTAAGLELSDEDKYKIVKIRLNNKKIHRDQREYTQSALNLSLPQIKISLDSGTSIKELLGVWEGNGWIKWKHSWHSKEIASDIKAQSIHGNQNNISFAQGDKLDKAFQDIKTTLQFCYSTYIDPQCPADKKGEWNVETIRNTVHEHLIDLQLSENQRSMLLRMLQAWLIVEHSDLAKEMNFNIQIGAQLAIGGAGNE